MIINVDRKFIQLMMNNNSKKHASSIWRKEKEWGSLVSSNLNIILPKKREIKMPTKIYLCRPSKFWRWPARANIEIIHLFLTQNSEQLLLGVSILLTEKQGQEIYSPLAGRWFLELKSSNGIVGGKDKSVTWNFKNKFVFIRM